ncbi:uncharacterized protein M6D78_006190 [Vipera latastei]
MGTGGPRALLLGFLVLSAGLMLTGAGGNVLARMSAGHWEPPPGPAPGAPGPGKHGICITQCQSDGDCAGGRQCCPTGCGFVCRAECRWVHSPLPGRGSGSPDGRSWIQ